MGKRFKELTEEQTKLLEEFELEDENEQIKGEQNGKTI